MMKHVITILLLFLSSVVRAQTLQFKHLNTYLSVYLQAVAVLPGCPAFRKPLQGYMLLEALCQSATGDVDIRIRMYSLK